MSGIIMYFSAEDLFLGAYKLFPAVITDSIAIMVLVRYLSMEFDATHAAGPPVEPYISTVISNS